MNEFMGEAGNQPPLDIFGQQYDMMNDFLNSRPQSPAMNSQNMLQASNEGLMDMQCQQPNFDPQQVIANSVQSLTSNTPPLNPRSMV